MNKNSESYKNTYSQLRPSAEAVERVMDMTNEKKPGFKPVFKRLTAAALALAIIICVGFGINPSPKNDDYTDELGVIAAYAYTLADQDDYYYEVEFDTNLDMFCALYVIPETDEVKEKEALDRWNYDYDEYNKKLYEAGFGYSKAINGRGCYNSLGQETAALYIIHTGSFVLDLDDYSEVKTFKVENKSKYGELHFDSDLYGRIGYTNTFPSSIEEFAERIANNFQIIENSRKIEISGDILRRSQGSKYYEHENGEYIINKGYTLKWWPSEELGKAIGNNLNFDLANVKDTIRFTVEFNDGSVKTGSIDLYFDSNGYMHFGK